MASEGDSRLEEEKKKKKDHLGPETGFYNSALLCTFLFSPLCFYN